MNPPYSPEDDPLVGYVVRRFAPEDESGPSDACPGDNALAKFAGGTLLAGEAEGLEAHLGRCARCSEIAGILSSRARAPAARRALAAAAAVLLAIGAVGLGPRILSRSGDPGATPPSETEGRLLAVAADLARSRPDLFSEFVPLSREERLARGPQLRAGDLALLYPSGRIFEARPDFRWESGSDREDEIVLRTARGETLWRGTGKAPRLAYPAEAPDLEAGARYVWEVSREGRRIFATASAAQRDAFAAAAAEIEATAPAALRPLLRAHLAIRGEHFAEAERAARAFVDAQPRDAVGRETLAHALRRMGSSEADEIEAAGGR